MPTRYCTAAQQLQQQAKVQAGWSRAMVLQHAMHWY
jgi:hypothetical protein